MYSSSATPRPTAEERIITLEHRVKSLSKTVSTQEKKIFRVQRDYAQKEAELTEAYKNEIRAEMELNIRKEFEDRISTLDAKNTKLEQESKELKGQFDYYRVINEPLLDVAHKVMRRCMEKIRYPTHNGPTARIGNEAAHQGNILATLGLLHQVGANANDVILFRTAFDVELEKFLGPGADIRIELLRAFPNRTRLYNMYATMKSRGSFGATVSRGNDTEFLRLRAICFKILKQTLASCLTAGEAREGFQRFEKNAVVIAHLESMAGIVAKNYELYKQQNKGSAWCS